MGGVLVLPGFRGFWSGPGSRGVGGGVTSLRRGAVAKRDTIGRCLPSRCDLGCRLPKSILDVIQEYRMHLGGGGGERMRVMLVTRSSLMQVRTWKRRWTMRGDDAIKLRWKNKTSNYVLRREASKK